MTPSGPQIMDQSSITHYDAHIHNHGSEIITPTTDNATTHSLQIIYFTTEFILAVGSLWSCLPLVRVFVDNGFEYCVLFDRQFVIELVAGFCFLVYVNAF